MPITYLGFPLMTRKLKKIQWSPFIEKIQKKIGRMEREATLFGRKDNDD